MSIKIPFLSEMLNLSRKRGDPLSEPQQIEHKLSEWQPSYLQRRVLIIFAVLFCGVIAALEALNHVSEVHYAIASSYESRHYLWTYVPTTIFTIIATFWSRVEFQVKQRAPWKSMAEKPAEAGESILLDYVSGMQPASLAKAIKNKHFDVAAAVACSMLLRLSVIFSTGLFSLQTGHVRQKSVSITIVSENRIAITQVSLRVTEVCMILGILLAVSMIILGPHTTIAPWNPTSLSSVATIMAKSNEIGRSLRGTGVAPSDALGDSLKERRYYSQLTPDGFLVKTEAVDIRRLHNQEKHTLTWVPFPGLIARGVIFSAVALLAVALEIAFRVSQKNDGLGDVCSNGYQHYLWTIIPSLVMLSVGVLFERMDFNTRSLVPYAQLKRPAGALFEESMAVNYPDSLPTTHIVRSIRRKHFAILATTLAALLTSFLVIVTSGLYSTVEVPHRISLNFTQESTLYQGNSADADQNSSVIVAKDILLKNLTFPRWTYDELAFPKLSMDMPLSSNDAENSFVDIRMPALRAAPACYFQTGSQLQWNFTKVKYGNESTYQLRVLAPSMPCSLEGQDVGSTSSTSSPVLLRSQGLFGQSLMLPCGNSHITKPATLYIWGDIQIDSAENISAMTCIGAAETVDTLTRFHLPGFDITDDHHPVPDESSVRSAPDVDIPWISWNSFNTTDATAENPNLDGFFAALIMGKYAIPAENLLNPDSSDMVIKAINHQDRILKAQVFNNYSRGAADGVLDHAHVPGNVTVSNRLRLLQDATSTRVLEALLASILVLGIISSILINTDHVLPENPSSIAAVASLLADSNILARYKKVVGDPNERSLAQAFFPRCRFFLGFQRDVSDQGDPWQLSEDQGCEKYCVYFSERDGETMLGNGSMWMTKEFRAKGTRVEERLA
ncbi:unnamed protein product [Penicillium egyptiacum]|uniref:Uncharacterized protein n=1 Tax=Penicillium egyptiacum TaxID=1303716 RepID=A0A9W4P4G1_9EURO|nr:unnamed protein product [Penicillium egyptiacum]